MIPPIPPRSRLLRPEPKGLGTGAIESLRSYLIRLARLHFVTPIQMVFECVPEFRRVSHSKKLSQYWNSKRKEAITAFEAHTCRNDLRHLAPVKWEDCISREGMYARRQKWCPYCVKEDPYEHLLWTIEHARSCPIHECDLQSVCLCGYVSGVRNLFPSWQICKKCGHRHADTIHADNMRIQSSTQRDLQDSRQLDKLLAKGQKATAPSIERIKEVWDKVILPRFETKAEACQVLGVSPSVVYQLGVGRRYGMAGLLGLSHSLGIDLVDLLTADLSQLNPVLVKQSSSRPPSRVVLKMDELEPRIKEALLAIPANRLTARSVSQFVGISSQRLNIDFPDLAQRLKTTRKIALLSRTRERRQRVLDHMVLLLREDPRITQTRLLKLTGVTPYPQWIQLEKKARLMAHQPNLPGM